MAKTFQTLGGSLYKILMEEQIIMNSFSC